MNIAAIIHRPTLDYIYACDDTHLCIKIQTARDDIKKLTLKWWFRSINNEECVKSIDLYKTYSDKYVDYYADYINIDSLPAYVRYYFLIDDGKKEISFGAKGYLDGKAKINENFFEFLWPNKTDNYCAPKWCDNQIYYQIFPERFKNGDNRLNPKNAIAWGSKPTRDNFMGGDIKGIIDKLDYIEDLGATCLYLTPIFVAPSNHKYDTVDYYNINPSFGTKDDLRKLVNEVHRRNMRIILDGVFNHCGYYWPMFQDVVNNGDKSKYKDWFFVESYPISLVKQNYHCVGHYKWMPKINLSNPDTAEYFIRVGEYWIKEFNIDGWRLDVADEVPLQFWSSFSERIKRINNNVILLGETWSDAGNLLSVNRLDSAMNYLFKDAVVDWIAKGIVKPSQFDHLINKMYSLYPIDVAYRLYNPLDSHDTSRFKRECNDDLRKYFIGIALQMTMIGCPAIFYGDEIGLSGDNDPDCRMCMEWNEELQNREILDWYKKLISIRKRSPALIHGDYHTLICDDENNIYSFCRSYKDEKVVVIVNAGNKEKEVNLSIDRGLWSDLLQNSYIAEDAYSIFVKIAANSVHILKKGER